MSYAVKEIFYTLQGEGARAGTFGALLLGLYDEGRPVYVGRVGTGFTDADLDLPVEVLEIELTPRIVIVVEAPGTPDGTCRNSA